MMKWVFGVDSRRVWAKTSTVTIGALLAVTNVLNRRVSDDTDALRLLFEILCAAHHVADIRHAVSRLNIAVVVETVVTTMPTVRAEVCLLEMLAPRVWAIVSAMFAVGIAAH